MSTIEPQLEQRLDKEAADLAREFVGVYDAATVRRHVFDALDQIPRAQVDHYLPVFARKLARQLLHSTARWKGAITVTQPLVLFVCVHNAGRSQMAAAFARQLGGDRVEVLSAGSAPAESIHRNVHDAMREVGIDLTEEFPKRLSDDFVRGSDVVITMGCGDACPVFPGKRYEDWKVEDPAGQPLAKVREIRESLRDRVRRLLEELGVLE